MINFFKKNLNLLNILIISILGYVFFFYHINTYDLHFDEIHWFYWSDPSLTFFETVDRLNNYISSHPPLFSLINKFFLNFKNETHILRYITAVNMIINSIIFYFILRKLFNSYFYSVFGSVLFITNIFIIFYAQRFANYSLLLFFELFSFLYLLKLLENKKKEKNLIIFSLINFLGLATHLYFLLYLAPIGVWLLLHFKKKINIIVSIIFSIGIFLLLGNNFILNAFKVGFSNTNVTFDLINSHFLVYFYGGKYLAYLSYFFIAIYCSYLFHKRNKLDLIFILFLIIPYLTVYLFNLVIGNAWVDGKHLIFFIPFLIIIFFKVTNYIKFFYDKKYFYIIPIILIFFGQLIALYRNYYPNEFNKNLIRRNVELKGFLNDTKKYHDIIFVIEKGDDTWPGFNHNLKYFLKRNLNFKDSKIFLIDTEDEKMKKLNEFIYIYFRDTEKKEGYRRINTFLNEDYIQIKTYKDYQIKAVYFKKKD